MDEPINSPDTDTRWHEVSLWCRGWQAAERMAITLLGPQLIDAQREQIISSWWFVRKGACWRVRYLSVPGRDTHAITTVHQVLHDLAIAGSVQRWAATRYEPELHAFGGALGMDIAHDLFGADSHHLLDHLRRTAPGADGATAWADHQRELGLLLGAALARGAGQDWYEQGDMWARVAAHRTTSPPPNAVLDRVADDVHRLITARAGSEDSPLTAAPGWAAAFEHTGGRLANLAQQGDLTRGLRAVLAQHVLFSWNRAGIPAQQQAFLATTAARVVFHIDPDHLDDILGSLAASAVSQAAVTLRP